MLKKQTVPLLAAAFLGLFAACMAVAALMDKPLFNAMGYQLVAIIAMIAAHYFRVATSSEKATPATPKDAGPDA